MEIEGSDGSKTRLKPNSNTVFGRGNGFPSTDLSVSRRHLSFDFNPSSNTQTAPRVSFEVLGKNPIWVFNEQNQNGKIKAFKRFERGELGVDDLFCISPKTPIWFTLKKVEEGFEERERKVEGVSESVNDELSESLESISGFNGNEDFGLDPVDLSNIDPVKEFGFLVIGHEFDQYPKQMIRDINQWNWFLDDPKRGDSDDEDSEEKGTTSGRGKRKFRRGDNDDDVDEEWTAESEGEEVTMNARKVQKPKYHTRSKGQGVMDRKSSAKTTSRAETEDSENEDDETLGGFVVHDDTIEEDEDEEMDEDEEEEFVEDEEELEE